MHYMIRRAIALFLAGLLMLGTGGLSSYALQPGEPNPQCRLGTTPLAMLAGGGKTVETERGVYYLDDDSSVCSYPSQSVLIAGPVSRLNYENGVLYYARLGSDVSFDLCSFDLNSRRETTLLEDFPGQPGQIYLVDGQALDFSAGDEIWQLELSTGACSLLQTVEQLWSYVPTGCGLICASGSLFDYSLVADGRLLADHVEDYYVDFALEGGMLIYTRDGGSEQLALSELFAGKIQPVAFEGYEAPVVEESREPEAEALFFNESFEESSVEDTPLDPNDPQSPMRSSQEAVLDVNASLAAMSARAENVGAVCKPCAVDPVPVEPHDGALRRNVSNGVMNIVRRSRQMLNIRWTPQKNVSSWGYAQTYEKGVTYTGLPYCQLCSYVPWNTGLDEFLNAVNDPNSKMYTARTTYGRTGPFYGIDCSAFATWAWGNASRGTTWSMKADSNNLYIGTDYLKLQLGDALLSDSHVMLVTDITYNSDGSIKTVEISHSSNTYSTVGCCNSMHFSGTDGLLKIKQSYLDKGYGIYRSANRDQVGYTHSCAVPLEGDVCSKCGVGIPAEPVVPETPEVPENDAFFKSGIDVSRWQGQIDWKKVSTQIDFAILRVGYTGAANPVPVEDNTFEENVAGCEANGIPYGVYYYAGATSPEQAVKEAEAVLEYLGTRTTSKALRLPVFYDVEEKENVLKLSNAELIEVVSAFCTRLEKEGLRVGVYASASVWNKNLADEFYNQRPRWVAHWKPKGTDVNGGATAWQYDVQEGIDGINGLVDRDYWFGSFDNNEHRYVTKKTTVSCTEDGVFSATCVHCKQYYEEGRSPALGHSYSNYVCTRCGEAMHAWDRFTDVEAGAWYSDAVDFVTAKKYFNGISETEFGNEDAMTRCMLVTVLYRMAGTPNVKADNPFVDLEDKAYYVPAVLWGVQNGIVCGTGNAQFSPELEVTREQMATFLYRYLLKLDSTNQDSGTLKGFADSGMVSDFAKQSMAWAVGAGIIRGTTVNNQLCLKPKSPATRAEVAVMLQRFADYLTKRGL